MASSTHLSCPSAYTAFIFSLLLTLISSSIFLIMPESSRRWCHRCRVRLKLIFVSEDYRMELNNRLQRNGNSRALTWWTGQTGQLHQAVWTAIAYRTLPYILQIFDHFLIFGVIVNGVEWGRGQATTSGAAKEEAACQVLEAMNEDMMMRAQGIYYGYRWRSFYIGGSSHLQRKYC